MQIGRIEGATRVLGKSQGYLGLPIRDVVLDPSGLPAMQSVWFPTPAEIEAINLGAPVLVQILGAVHPPIMLDVGEVPS